MRKSWLISTQNDPLGVIREVLGTIWEEMGCQKALLLLNGNADFAKPTIITSSDLIQKFNPFTPLMPINAATLVPELVGSDDQVVAVLRPCELRSWSEMNKLGQNNVDKLLTVCIDCLGTLPVDEYEWRVKRINSPKGLSQEALQFARQGGILPYRFRAACQICMSPAATEADINIGVLGLPVRQYLNISYKKEVLEDAFTQLKFIPVPDELNSQHQRIVSRLEERGQETRKRIFSGLVGVLPDDIDKFTELLNNCGECRACLDACPICSSEFLQRNIDDEFNRNDVLEWLVSCSECGMCEQACPKHIPLTIILGNIRNQLTDLTQ